MKMRTVTVDIEIPDDAVLGPAMGITYAQRAGLVPGGKGLQIAIHASIRYNFENDPAQDREPWFKALRSAMKDAETH